jgi:ATP-binding cassette subfamily F protein 3
MISVENLGKGYGGQVLFEEAGFKINSGERVGLVGRNGHGKTTLFRMIVGEETPDSGTISLPRSYRIGYVRQHIDFTEETALAEGMKGLLPTERDHHWKVEKVLAGLGFSEADLRRRPEELSSGYQIRLNFAKVLVSEPDLLLLDEPTNFLDIASIRWVERFLTAWPRELMVITHDRSFMDKVVTHILGIHRRKIRKIPGDTGKFYEQIAQDEEVYEKTRQNDERRRKEIELFISRFRAKARLANMVQSRVKTLSRMQKKDRLEHVQSLDFSFRSKPFPAKQILRVRDLSFSYSPEKPLFRSFGIHVGAGERICVIGRNGKGKTTLLKLLAGKLTPLSGEIGYHPATEKGFYEQEEVRSLVAGRTVEEEILYSHRDVDRQHSRNICGAMMFGGDDALKKIHVLSGGEKARVLLGKLLVTPVNLLLLDEPTNHLDMDSSDALLAALDEFPGTVIMVTHNEMFLHALAERLIVFQNGGVTVFEGGYGSFLEKGGWQDEETPARPEPGETAGTGVKPGRKELRRKRSEIVNERSRALKPLEDRIAKTEKEIERKEKDLQALNDSMQEASLAGDGKKIADIARSLHTCRSAIEGIYATLGGLTEELDAANAAFERRLAEIDDAV